MTAPIWLRPSALSRLASCPASGVASEGLPSPSSQAASLGHAWHKLMEERIGFDLEHARARLPEIAVQHGVEADKLSGWLAALDVDLVGHWSGAEIMAEQHVEICAGGVAFSGRADLVAVWQDEGAIEVTDWKSGRSEHVDEGSWTQLEAYALGVARKHNAKRAKVTLHYAELGDAGWASRDVDLEAAQTRIDSIVRNAVAQVDRPESRRDYKVGDHCVFCPARAVCPARTLDLRSALTVFEGGPVLSRENVIPLVQRARQIEKLCKALRDAATELVEAEGGEVVADGVRLKLVEYERREYTVPAGKVRQLRESKI